MNITYELKKLYEHRLMQRLSLHVLILIPFLYVLFCRHEFLKQNLMLTIHQNQEIQGAILLYMLDMMPLLNVIIMIALSLIIYKLYSIEFSTGMYLLLQATSQGLQKAAFRKWLLSIIVSLGYALCFILITCLLLTAFYGLPDPSYQFQNSYQLYSGGIFLPHDFTLGTLYVKTILSFLTSITLLVSIQCILAICFKQALISLSCSLLVTLFLSIHSLSSQDIPHLMKYCSSQSIAIYPYRIFFILLLLSLLLLTCSAFLFHHKQLAIIFKR